MKFKKLENEIANKKKSKLSIKKFTPSPVVPAWIPTSVTLSKRDKAPQLILSDDKMICYGCEGGFRMIRATDGVHNGSYYWEIQIMKSQSENAHVRLGWSSRQGELQGPVGYDKYSYCYRDVNGAKVHRSVRVDNYGDPYGEGDIIGCFIKLDDANPDNNLIRFFKNGVDQGVAFKGKDDIPCGVYFPAISLYMKAVVNVNFGPNFILCHDRFDAISVSEVQPMSVADKKYHEERILAMQARFRARNEIS